MKKILFSFLAILVIFGTLISPIMGQPIAVLHGQTSDRKVGVSVSIDPPNAGHNAWVDVTFFEPNDRGTYVNLKDVRYSIQISQNEKIVLQEQGKMFRGPQPDSYKTSTLTSDTPYDINVFIVEVGTTNKWKPTDQAILFSNVVPEFGSIVGIILAISIISVIIFTKRSSMIIK